MALREQHADRPTHRVTNGDHRCNAEVLHECRGIIGRVDQLELVLTADSATMATVIDGDERVVLGERLVGGEELQIGAGRPAVQQQQGRRGRVGVAVVAEEDLTASRKICREARW
jgi:hypothetical protein